MAVRNLKGRATSFALLMFIALCLRSIAAQAQETNNAGDIPDTQAFVTYRSTADGYQLDVPEGWARATKPHQVTFTSKLNAVSVSVEKASSLPSTPALRAKVSDSLGSSGVTIRDVQSVRLASGEAMLVRFTSRSQPDPVTERSRPLENDAYFVYSRGRLARILLSAPLKADNADQWQRIVKSFRWV